MSHIAISPITPMKLAPSDYQIGLPLSCVKRHLAVPISLYVDLLPERLDPLMRSLIIDFLAQFAYIETADVACDGLSGSQASPFVPF
jgi:hypothetical protein